MRIAHAADIHIRNLKYHYEYKEVFNQFYESLKEENVDCIVLCGDIAHTKTQISPEFVKMSSDLFRTLADIAPTYIIWVIMTATYGTSPVKTPYRPLLRR